MNDKTKEIIRVANKIAEGNAYINIETTLSEDGIRKAQDIAVEMIDAQYKNNFKNYNELRKMDRDSLLTFAYEEYAMEDIDFNFFRNNKKSYIITRILEMQESLINF